MPWRRGPAACRGSYDATCRGELRRLLVKHGLHARCADAGGAATAAFIVALM